MSVSGTLRVFACVIGAASVARVNGTWYVNAFGRSIGPLSQFSCGWVDGGDGWNPKQCVVDANEFTQTETYPTREKAEDACLRMKNCAAVNGVAVSAPTSSQNCTSSTYNYTTTYSLVIANSRHDRYFPTIVDVNKTAMGECYVRSADYRGAARRDNSTGDEFDGFLSAPRTGDGNKRVSTICTGYWGAEAAAYNDSSSATAQVATLSQNTNDASDFGTLHDACEKEGIEKNGSFLGMLVFLPTSGPHAYECVCKYGLKGQPNSAFPPPPPNVGFNPDSDVLCYSPNDSDTFNRTSTSTSTTTTTTTSTTTSTASSPSTANGIGTGAIVGIVLFAVGTCGIGAVAIRLLGAKTPTARSLLNGVDPTP